MVVVDKTLMLSGICGSIRALCSALSDKLVSDVIDGEGDDFIVKNYGGVEIDPTIILNFKISKCLDKLRRDDADFDALESELLRLLIMKRSGSHLSDAIAEAGVERLKAKMAENEQALAAAKLAEQVQEAVAAPEVKKRRKRKQPAASEFVDGADVINSLNPVEPEAEVPPVVDPFEEVEKVEDIAPVSKVVILSNEVVTPTSMDDFLKQERLKALAALSGDELSI